MPFDVYLLGNCLEVFEGKVIKNSCFNFSSGCPANHFFEYEFFKCKFFSFSKNKLQHKFIFKMFYTVYRYSCYIEFRIFNRPCMPKHQHRVSLLYCGSVLSNHSTQKRIIQLYRNHFNISWMFDSRRRYCYWYHRVLSVEKKK